VALENSIQFPLSAHLACEWTLICTPPPLGPDVHPNRQGYGVIAAAFEEVLLLWIEPPSRVCLPGRIRSRHRQEARR
jgi:hypothetical protein